MTKQNIESQFLGLTLAEARNLHSRIRILRVGNTAFVGTTDLRTDRLNVCLSEEGLAFEMTTLRSGQQVKSFSDEELEKAIIVSAHIG